MCPMPLICTPLGCLKVIARSILTCVCFVRLSPMPVISTCRSGASAAVKVVRKLTTKVQARFNSQPLLRISLQHSYGLPCPIPDMKYDMTYAAQIAPLALLECNERIQAGLTVAAPGEVCV